GAVEDQTRSPRPARRALRRYRLPRLRRLVADDRLGAGARRRLDRGVTVMDDAELRRQIVGTWTLVSVVYEDVVTKERTPLYGEHPRGIQIATSEGRWLALMTAEGRSIPKI